MKYRISGVFNALTASEAIQVEAKIVVMLYCYEFVEKNESDEAEITIIDSVASMKAIEN